MDFEKITEKESHYNHLEKMTVKDIISKINNEDKTVANAVEKVLPKVEVLIEKILEKLEKGGRLLYMGAGTSGRLGVLDASECPPTFGVPDNLVIGIIAGGDKAIRKAVEFAEDSTVQGWKDLKKHKVSEKDFVIGIAASGTTPYVVSAMLKCGENKISTACITCNPNSPLSKSVAYPIEVVVGPEFITGSSRMKAGTAQKMILNMISTTTMIQLGHIKGNKMVDMQLSNEKLVNRGVAMLKNELGVKEQEAILLLEKYGSVRAALKSINHDKY